MIQTVGVGSPRPKSLETSKILVSKFFAWARKRRKLTDDR